MNKLIEAVEKAQTIAIGAHIRPDGDAVGSTIGLYSYLIENYKDKEVTAYLDGYLEEFHILPQLDQVSHNMDDEKVYDLYIALDTSNTERLQGIKIFENARETICIDHHITNEGYAMENIIRTASATAEIMFDLLELEKMPLATCSALYMGIIHDTGVFKHSNTTRHTMEVAGRLIEKGVDQEQLIDSTFYNKTYVQNQLLGRALLECFGVLDKKIMISVIKQSYFDFYEAQPADLEGVVDQLRVTIGTEVAILIYETEKHDYKVSMRSNGKVDVSKIASSFGGGGHIMAAGCTMDGRIYEVINRLTYPIEQQLIAYQQADGE